jgi:hypothetical protein
MMENNRYQNTGFGELQLRGPNMKIDAFVPDAPVPRSPTSPISKDPAMASQKKVSSDLPLGMGILSICGAVGALLYTIAAKVGWRHDTPVPALQLAGAGAGATPVARVTPSRSGALRMSAEDNSRWKDDILNESIPDPVFDQESGYLGSVAYGFSTTAENWNGKAAMMGFTILFLQELILGKGVLELWGFLDPGANPPA